MTTPSLRALFPSTYACKCGQKLEVRYGGEDTDWWCSRHGIQTAHVLAVAPMRRKKETHVIDTEERRNGAGQVSGWNPAEEVVPPPAPRPWHEIARAELALQGKRVEALRAQLAPLEAEYQRTHAALTAYGLEGLPPLLSESAQPEAARARREPRERANPGERKPQEPKECAYCGQAFTPVRYDQKFCLPEHRVSFNQEGYRRGGGTTASGSVIA